jgi:uroporphyrinogen decarboxylase
LCKNPDLAAQVTVEAAHDLDVDAAIIFSDILLITEPLGFKLSFGKDQGPIIGNPLRNPSDVQKMKNVEPNKSLSFVLDAIRTTRKNLKSDVPLIGFAGAPFTVAAYVIEGGTSKNFSFTKEFMNQHPQAWKACLNKITEATIHYLNAQAQAGAQALQIFDSWVGCLSPAEFQERVYPHLVQLVKGIQGDTPIVFYGRGTEKFFPLLKKLGVHVIGVDAQVELGRAWGMLGDVAVQGNLDPGVLLKSPDEIKKEAQRILDQAGGRPGHIFNLGHGVYPQTPEDHVRALIDCVKEYSQRRN